MHPHTINFAIKRLDESSNATWTNSSAWKLSTSYLSAFCHHGNFPNLHLAPYIPILIYAPKQRESDYTFLQTLV